MWKKKTDTIVTKVKISDEKIWVKPYAVLADMAKHIEDKTFSFGGDCHYTFLEDMMKFCGKKVTLTKIEEKTDGGEYVFRIREDNEHFYWYGGWLTNVDPTAFPEQFGSSETSTKKEEEQIFVSDFGGTEEKELSPAEKFFYNILPQLKEVVVNAYNEEMKSRGEQDEA